MAPPRHVIYDSDDDDLSPLTSPLSPPHEFVPAPAATKPADASTSTDPSFFRDVYEDQQRAPALPDTASFGSEGREAGAIGATITAKTDRDLWDVPSSPDLVDLPRAIKRKRYSQPAPDDHAVVDIEGVGGAPEPPAKRQRKTDGGEDESFFSAPMSSSSSRVAAGGLEISIPLEPLTPNKMRQYQILNSSGHRRSEHPASAAATLSTIAYTTPSQYASSGRRRLGSSDNNHTGEALEHVEEVTEDAAATPPRRTRKAPAAAQLMSSPDIIAEPAMPSRRNKRARESTKGEEDLQEPKGSPGATSHRGGSTHRHRRRNSASDELAEDEEAEKVDTDWDSSRGSPLRKSSFRAAKSTSTNRRKQVEGEARDDGVKGVGVDAIYIATLDDDRGGTLSSAESDFSVKATKSKGKRGRKKRETKAKTRDTAQEPPLDDIAVCADGPDRSPASKAKKPRGRPKQRTTQRQTSNDDLKGGTPEDVNARSEAKQPLGSGEARDVKPETKPETKLEAKPEVKPEAKPEAKPGTRVEATASEAALHEISGNAGVGSNPSSFSDDAATKVKGQELEEKKSSGVATKPSTTIGLCNGSSQGRVPFRVGLSKNSRIAPLLKSIRK